MKLSEAQALSEQAIYDYTSSTKWQQVKYMTWTTAEMQDVIAKALVKNIEVIQCCMGEAEQLKALLDYLESNIKIGFEGKELIEMCKNWVKCL